MKKWLLYASPFHFNVYMFECSGPEGTRNVTGFLKMPMAFRKIAAPSRYGMLFLKHLLGQSIFIFLPLGVKLSSCVQDDLEELASKALHHNNRHSGIWWYTSSEEKNDQSI